MFLVPIFFNKSSQFLEESSDSDEEMGKKSEAKEMPKRQKGGYDERIIELEKNIELKRNELQRTKGLAEEERNILANELQTREVHLFLEIS